jgi:L-alanine-DL-glutamate epimerase-like enolase superfamily enzyme
VRIAGLKTFVVDAFRANYVFVKVLTDEGLHGLGEGTVEHRPVIGLNSIHEASSCKGLVPGRPCPLLLSDLRGYVRGYATSPSDWLRWDTSRHRELWNPALRRGAGAACPPAAQQAARADASFCFSLFLVLNENICRTE